MAKALKYKRKHHSKKPGLVSKHIKVIILVYSPLLLIVALALIVNDVWLANSHGVLGISTAISPSSLLADTNTQRAAYQENKLTLNSQLMSAAQTKANNMVKLNYWSHDTPSGEPPWTFIENAGYKFHKAGENLAYGFTSSSSVLNAWMHSPEHRANILDSNFTNVGFGIAYSPNYQNQGPQTLVVAMYAQPAVVTTASAVSGILTPASQRLNWAQVIFGNNSSWIGLGVGMITAFLTGYMLIKHGRKWKRVVTHGEEFIIHHPWIDMAVMCIIMFGVVISSTAGYIG